MMPPLQTILFGTYTPPTPTQTRTHRLIADSNYRNQHTAPISKTTLMVKELLTGNKWWTILEACNHLKVSQSAVYTVVSRYRAKFGVQSYTDIINGHQVKFYRIKDNGHE